MRLLLRRAEFYRQSSGVPFPKSVSIHIVPDVLENRFLIAELPFPHSMAFLCVGHRCQSRSPSFKRMVVLGKLGFIDGGTYPILGKFRTYRIKPCRLVTDLRIS